MVIIHLRQKDHCGSRTCADRTLSEKVTRSRRITHKKGTLMMYVVERSLELTQSKQPSFCVGFCKYSTAASTLELPLTNSSRSVGLV
jgi:hypothetical protein